MGKDRLSDPAEQNWCEELYEAKAAELVLYGRALGLSHAESEDVLQETFIALMALETAPRNPLFYCLRTFRNRALNLRRGLWRRIARELESSRWFERGEGESEQERAAMKCLGQLPPEQREAIVLKIWHQHTFEEIGEILEISPNTVAGRYRYGLQKIRACLTQEAAAQQLDDSMIQRFNDSATYEQLESTGAAFGILDAPATISRA